MQENEQVQAAPQGNVFDYLLGAVQEDAETGRFSGEPAEQDSAR